jgi:hypothetical protein
LPGELKKREMVPQIVMAGATRIMTMQSWRVARRKMIEF